MDRGGWWLWVVVSDGMRAVEVVWLDVFVMDFLNRLARNPKCDECFLGDICPYPKRKSQA